MANAVIGSLTNPDFTIECRFSINTAVPNMYLMGKMTSTVEWAIRLDAADSDILVLDLFEAGGTDRTTVICSSLSAAGVFADSAWHWLSIRMDRNGTAFLSCKIDSASSITAVNVSSWGTVWRVDNASVFAAGADGVDGTNVWNGGIDEIAIYLKALTDSERAAIYLAQSGYGAITGSLDSTAPVFTQSLSGSSATPTGQTSFAVGGGIGSYAIGSAAISSAGLGKGGALSSSASTFSQSAAGFEGILGSLHSTGPNFSSIVRATVADPIQVIFPFEVTVNGLLIDGILYDSYLTANVKQRTSASIGGGLSVSIKSRTTSVNKAVRLSSSIKNKLEATLCL